MTPLAAFQEVAGREFREHFQPDCCINGSRIAMDVLPKFGWDAKPLSVHFIARNEKTGFSVEIDTQKGSDEKWPGHLVIITRGYLLDVSAGQADRPEKGIVIPQMLVGEIREGFLDRKLIMECHLPYDTVVSYLARPNDRSYLDCGGWRRYDMNQQMERRIVDQMKQLLRKK